VEQTIYIHGGFEQITPNIPINIIATIETERLFASHELLLKKVKNQEKKDKTGALSKDKAGFKKSDPSRYDFEMQKGEKEFKLSN
jgi:hypothetical protein